MTASEPLDLALVMAEIEAEARRLRREDVVPITFERELDAVFGRLAPPAAAENYETALASAEELAYVDPHAPVLSVRRSSSTLKRVVRKSVFFYGNYLTAQVTAFATSMARSVRLLGRRVDTLEATIPATSTRVRAAFTAADAADYAEEWGSILAAHLSTVTGRILVGECGSGAIVRLLNDHGLDAYGVEPVAARADAAARAGLEVREAEVVDHLRLVGPGLLGAVVLVGCVDRLPLGVQLELFELSTHALAPGGTLAVVTETVNAVVSTADPRAIDLAPGRPLHPATWNHLFVEHGFAGLQVLSGSTARVFEPVPSTAESADALNRNFDRLEELLAGPCSALVVGSRAVR